MTNHVVAHRTGCCRWGSGSTARLTRGLGQSALSVVSLTLIGKAAGNRPGAIIADLDLLRPIYAQTAAYGHFGREEPDFTWERTDRADALRAAAGI